MYSDFWANRPAAVINEEAPEEESEPWLTPQMFYILLGILAALCAAALMGMRRLQKRKRLMRVSNLPPNQQAIAYYHALMSIVTYYTIPLAPAETDKAYGKRMGKRFAFRSDSVFLRDIIALYYKAKYSPATISPDEVSLMQEAHGDMVQLLRSMRHKFVFFFLRNIRTIGDV
jgi:hypothetical protein